jgi:chromosome segregation ATPase
MNKTLFTAILILAIGCSTSAPNRSARAVSSLEVLQQNSGKARTQIDEVTSSLETLMNAAPERLREAYDRYDRSVSRMIEYAGALRENEHDLQTNGRTYLSQWQKDASSVTDPELRAVAEQRQNEMEAKNASMRTTVTAAVQSFTAFERDISDIRKVIGNDLTATGQNAVRNTTLAQSVRDEGARVKSALQDAEAAIAELRTQITPASK